MSLCYFLFLHKTLIKTDFLLHILFHHWYELKKNTVTLITMGLKHNKGFWSIACVHFCPLDHLGDDFFKSTWSLLLAQCRRVSSARKIHTICMYRHIVLSYLYFYFNSVGPKCICSNTGLMELTKLNAVSHFKKHSCWSLYMIDKLWIFSHHLNDNGFSTGKFLSREKFMNTHKYSWSHHGQVILVRTE